MESSTSTVLEKPGRGVETSKDSPSAATPKAQAGSRAVSGPIKRPLFCYQETPEGFRICKGKHDKSQPCEWIELVRKNDTDGALRAEMLDMLKYCLGYVEDARGLAVDQVRAVIAKAEGQ